MACHLKTEVLIKAGQLVTYSDQSCETTREGNEGLFGTLLTNYFDVAIEGDTPSRVLKTRDWTELRWMLLWLFTLQQLENHGRLLTCIGVNLQKHCAASAHENLK